MTLCSKSYSLLGMSCNEVNSDLCGDGLVFFSSFSHTNAQDNENGVCVTAFSDITKSTLAGTPSKTLDTIAPRTTTTVGGDNNNARVPSTASESDDSSTAGVIAAVGGTIVVLIVAVVCCVVFVMRRRRAGNGGGTANTYNSRELHYTHGDMPHQGYQDMKMRDGSSKGTVPIDNEQYVGGVQRPDGGYTDMVMAPSASPNYVGGALRK